MTVLNTSAVLNRRSLLLGAALAGTTGLLAACSGGNGSSAGSAQSSSNLLESIKSAGKIRIGVEGTYRPYTYHDASGKLAGFEYDIAETLAKDLGVTAEYIETPWDSLIAGVDAGRYDIVLNNVAPTEERKKKYDFSVPYAHSRARVGVKKDSSLRTPPRFPATAPPRVPPATTASSWKNAAPPSSRSPASTRPSSRCSPAAPS